MFAASVCVGVNSLRVTVRLCRRPVDVHRAEPPLQARAEGFLASTASQVEQRGRLPLGGR